MKVLNQMLAIVVVVAAWGCGKREGTEVPGNEGGNGGPTSPSPAVADQNEKGNGVEDGERVGNGTPAAASDGGSSSGVGGTAAPTP